METPKEAQRRPFGAWRDQRWRMVGAEWEGKWEGSLMTCVYENATMTPVTLHINLKNETDVSSRIGLHVFKEYQLSVWIFKPFLICTILKWKITKHLNCHHFSNIVIFWLLLACILKTCHYFKSFLIHIVLLINIYFLVIDLQFYQFCWLSLFFHFNSIVLILFFSKRSTLVALALRVSL